MIKHMALQRIYFWLNISLFSVVIMFLHASVADDNHNSNYVLNEVIVNADKPMRIFTHDELQRYDGTDEREPILMGIKGAVFDVSSGKKFYGKDAPYNVLVGKDSTKAVAKMSLDPDDLTSDISDLSDSQLKALDDVFEGTYMSKYKIIGYMDYFVKRNPEKFTNAKIIKSEL